MSQPLRILHLEDNPRDAELVQAMLTADGLACDLRVIKSREEFASALDQNLFDLIISDFSLPSYDGRSALLLARERYPDVPFIFFSGTIGEDAAIEALRDGATDYVLKQRHLRLIPAVRRALNEAKERAERKRAEEKLQQAQERFRGIYESSKDAIGYATLDGLLLDVNESFAKLTSYSKDELLTKTYQSLTPMEYRRTEADIINAVIRTGEAAEYKKEYIRKDGTKVPIALTVFVVKGSDGKPNGLAVLIKDITERKRTEARQAAQLAVSIALAESATLANAAPRLIQAICETTGGELGAIWMVDRAANTLRCESIWHLPGLHGEDFAAKSHEITFSQGVGMPGRVWTSRVPLWIPDVTKDPDFPRAPFATKAGLHSALCFPIMSKNEVIGVVEFFSHEIRQPDEHLLGMMTDVGIKIGQFVERKALEALVAQSRKIEAVGQLAGGIAHDFNNLLTVITGYSDMILKTLPPAHPVRAQIEQIGEAGKRAFSLTQQILAFSRQQTLAPIVFSLNDAVTSMAKLLRRLIGEHIALVTSPDPALGRVKADQGQIEQVIMNLAVNARDAMPSGGTLTVETRNVELDEAFARIHPSVKPGPYVKLAVRDTGCGMDAETQTHIFEPFFTTKEQGKGTGLGLATVYGIVTQSGGAIWVESEVGRGSTFSVYLPRVQGDVESVEQAGVSLDAPKGSETILLVEDEDMVRSLARQILRELGYAVLDARQGAKAQEICEKYAKPIHLLLTDLVMPGMNGRELAERLSSLRPEIKVLYMSGYTDNVLGQRGELPPDIAFLAKPFTPDSLARKVREVLDEGRES